mmetsp:Transcript_72808/g.144683  ORF Transcript_72808/g.144683 Transcript_72808/m.144683 type:complete len:109 (+) Transcript_72808:546-872(+)|eukprot:CAMPEP_0174698288 /NCGR_PEP_ID=MMETSP1094-20130205/3913_1 /TAXON_ID=156173 /ORGANISM="Chrysochromulina brevifilum, Strain UTEX LB 985" /LENGTH=108 /DNA_ID=CAMNT_0015895425 /DNA_START=517 /DNA_END=843 /DNA_ORIENTATION=-
MASWQQRQGGEQSSWQWALMQALWTKVLMQAIWRPASKHASALRPVYSSRGEARAAALPQLALHLQQVGARRSVLRSAFPRSDSNSLVMQRKNKAGRKELEHMSHEKG